ncbi:MAG TPA: TlyA family RNA methyltransferase [Clostridiales bacterium]|jgi:23S rRNA (cytidine1920-2'-O)/16S rRNA (cytidine1409-2'-O)-methyltransferase|nr:TlyA family RNA methyltransferase [Clostridiales bacterium]
MKNYRLDVYLHDKGYASSRERAKELILSNSVFVDDNLITKPSYPVNDDVKIKITRELYVSRGYVKIEKAMQVFDINIENKTAVDIGASTGGFTDYLLKHGAKKVYAVDVGTGQLHNSLRNDDRVINQENTNFRYIDTSIFTDDIDIITVDVSFISLKHILPKIVEISHNSTDIVALVKPQFEAGKENIGKKGIVKDKQVHLEVLNNLNNYIKINNLNLINIAYSPIKGASGNIEYLTHLKITGSSNEINFKDLVNQAFEIL